MEILLLADCPQHAPTIAKWLYYQWGQRPGNSIELTEQRVVARANRDSIPLAVVAVEDGRAVGTAALRSDDMPSRPDLGPWLASVYVAAAHRNRGIGSKLVAAVEQHAVRLGVEQLNLFTPDRETFYTRLGWHTIDHTTYHGKWMTVMQKTVP